MFRVELKQEQERLVMKIEGKLTGEYAEHARTVVTCCDPGTKLVVDLRDITYVDGSGEEVLTLLARMRAEFIADNPYTHELCERLELTPSRSNHQPIPAKPKRR